MRTDLQHWRALWWQRQARVLESFLYFFFRSQKMMWFCDRNLLHFTIDINRSQCLQSSYRSQEQSLSLSLSLFSGSESDFIESSYLIGQKPCDRAQTVYIKKKKKEKSRMGLGLSQTSAVTGLSFRWHLNTKWLFPPSIDKSLSFEKGKKKVEPNLKEKSKLHKSSFMLDVSVVKQYVG